MPSNLLILCRPLLLLPSVFPSIRVFSKESALRIRWLKYWSFSFSINPSNEHSELISFRMDWFDCLAVQGTLKSLFQHHSLKPSILWLSAFFMVRWAFTSCCWESGVERAGYGLSSKARPWASCPGFVPVCTRGSLDFSLKATSLWEVTLLVLVMIQETQNLWVRRTMWPLGPSQAQPPIYLPGLCFKVTSRKFLSTLSI